MNASVRRVERPALLGLVCAIAFGAAGLAGFSLWSQHAQRLAGPVTLVAETDEIADALADSPWTGSDSTGPIVWAFTAPDCADCGRLDAAAVAALSQEEMEIRMVVVAPRSAPEADPAAAALAESRDWTALERWAAGDAIAPVSADAAAREGYVEWGRASWDRVAAILRENDIDPRLPLLIWRRGPEWRVLPGGPAVTLDAVRRDMAVES
ncbi:MAG: hypothetical protein NW200_11830 [Hyphomonadaceae bacterium]|nr:hypothetical protein [Hyphomonadaceae bacterium]